MPQVGLKKLLAIFNGFANLEPSVRLLALSRHGKSSGELGSVMILDPIVGNSLGKKE
jgi:hypothetical protein